MIKYEQLFEEYISNKVVALVGPAQSILLSTNGEVIDKFQIVVRLNKSIPLPAHLAPHIGTRTDVIYNSLNVSDYPGENRLSTRLYKKHGVQFISSSYPFSGVFKQDILNYINKYKFDIPLKVFSQNKYDKLEKCLKTRPYTGTCAITDLLSYNIKLLFITGLDFYQTKYYEEYRVINDAVQNNTRNNFIHQAIPQLNYFRYLCLNDNRIVLDKFLEKIVFEKYDYFLDKILKFREEVFIFKNIDFKSIFGNFSKILYLNNYRNRVIPELNNFLIFTLNKSLTVNEITDKNYLILMGKEYNNNCIGTVYHYNINSMYQLMYINKKILDFIKHLLHKIEIRKISTVMYYILALVSIKREKNNHEIYIGMDELSSFTNEDTLIIKYLLRKKAINIY